MNWIEVAIWATALNQLCISAAHDHLYLIGEKRTTYFAWTRTSFSPLQRWVYLTREMDAAKAKANERKKRPNRR